MSAADQAGAAAALEAAIHELEVAIPGLNATKYLSVAGLVVLLYDHLLLFGEETRLIWSAKWSWSKALFLFSRYTVPPCLIVTTYQLSGFSAGLSTTTWMSMIGFFVVGTLAICNVFVVQRVYALWARDRRILLLLVLMFAVTYTATLISTAFATVHMIPHVSYSPIVNTCIVDKKPTLFVAAYASPICFDIFLFSLTCWNAFARPRHMQTAIVKQLCRDGVVYFVALLSLRIFNVVVLAVADKSYVQLGIYFIWSMITALINRMLITISSTVEDPQSIDPSGRETPYGQIQTPFELSEMISVNQGDPYASFIDMEMDTKVGTRSPPRLPELGPTDPIIPRTVLAYRDWGG